MTVKEKIKGLLMKKQELKDKNEAQYKGRSLGKEILLTGALATIGVVAINEDSKETSEKDEAKQDRIEQVSDHVAQFCDEEPLQEEKRESVVSYVHMTETEISGNFYKSGFNEPVIDGEEIIRNDGKAVVLGGTQDGKVIEKGEGYCRITDPSDGSSVEETLLEDGSVQVLLTDREGNGTALRVGAVKDHKVLNKSLELSEAGKTVNLVSEKAMSSIHTGAFGGGR